jgi:hypothetical protein
MAPEIIGAFIPIVFFLVAGLIWVSALYLRSREKQMLIEKGLTPDQIKEYFERKTIYDKKRKDSLVLMQIGIITIFFGLGLGIGLILQDITEKDYWVVLFLFTLTGVGFLVANLLARHLALKNNPEN